MTPSLEPIGGERSTGDDNREIVAAVRHGSAVAFRALFCAHYEVLCRYAYRFVRSRAIAEELVSDVFLRIWMQRARWEVHGSVRAYLFSATRNMAIDHLRRELVERQSLEATSRELRAAGGGRSVARAGGVGVGAGVGGGVGAEPLSWRSRNSWVFMVQCANPLCKIGSVANPVPARSAPAPEDRASLPVRTICIPATTSP